MGQGQSGPAVGPTRRRARATFPMERRADRSLGDDAKPSAGTSFAAAAQRPSSRRRGAGIGRLPSARVFVCEERVHAAERSGRHAETRVNRQRTCHPNLGLHLPGCCPAAARSGPVRKLLHRRTGGSNDDEPLPAPATAGESLVPLIGSQPLSRRAAGAAVGQLNRVASWIDVGCTVVDQRRYRLQGARSCRTCAE